MQYGFLVGMVKATRLAVQEDRLGGLSRRAFLEESRKHFNLDHAFTAWAGLPSTDELDGPLAFWTLKRTYGHQLPRTTRVLQTLSCRARFSLSKAAMM